MTCRTRLILLLTCLAVGVNAATTRPLPETIGVTNVYSDQATLMGRLTLDGRKAGQVSFQYREHGERTWRTQKPWHKVQRGETNVEFSSTIVGLAADTMYQIRPVAAFGGTRRTGQPITFQSTPSSPQVSMGSPEALSETDTRVHGVITPSGPGAIQFYFAYGPSPDYGYTNSGIITPTSGSISVEATANWIDRWSDLPLQLGRGKQWRRRKQRR